MEVKRGSIDSNDDHQTKPSSRGPDDLTYNMKRWLEQRPHEEPYCGLTVGLTQTSGHGKQLTKLVLCTLWLAMKLTCDFVVQRHGAEKRS